MKAEDHDQSSNFTEIITFPSLTTQKTDEWVDREMDEWINDLKKIIRGVPIVPQWKRIRLVTMRLRV